MQKKTRDLKSRDLYRESSVKRHYQIRTSNLAMTKVSVQSSVSPADSYPLRSWPISRIHCATPSVRVHRIVPTLKTTIIIDMPSSYVSSVWEAFGRDIEGNDVRGFQWVVYSLKLVIDPKAILSCEEGTVSTKGLHTPVVAHGPVEIGLNN